MLIRPVHPNLQATGTVCAHPNRAARRIGAFGRDESGALIIFGLMVFVLMLMIGGIAVDIARFEAVRTKLQNTSDASALAGAALSQTLDAEDVVTDYFAKAGLSDYLNGVTVQNSPNARIVSARARAEMPTFFMHLMGIDQLTAPADSTAEQRVSEIEITLVLDVSGSMNANNKLPNLKAAASQFVDTVLAGDTDQQISISIVPFNGQVNLGTTLASRYTLTTQHVLNTCVDIAPAEFAVASILPGDLLTRSDVLDPWGNGSVKSKPNGVSDQNYCTTDPRTVVRPFLRDIPTLKAAINALVAEGNTSIDVGVKWGIALMDPGTRPVITSLIGSGDVASGFAGRPYAYNRARSGKVIVVMSDGENTAQYQMQAGYRSGPSIMYRNPANGSLAVYHAGMAGPNKYYVIPKGNFAMNWKTQAMGTWQAAAPVGYVAQSWPDVSNLFPVYWIATRLYGNALGIDAASRSVAGNAWYGTLSTSVNAAAKDAQLTTVCDLAKAPAQNIRVFTVAFEAPVNGQAALSDCASSDGDYFDVNGPEITTAFQAIALQVSQLRLTQ